MVHQVWGLELLAYIFHSVVFIWEQGAEDGQRSAARWGKEVREMAWDHPVLCYQILNHAVAEGVSQGFPSLRDAQFLLISSLSIVAASL